MPSIGECQDRAGGVGRLESRRRGGWDRVFLEDKPRKGITFEM